MRAESERFARVVSVGRNAVWIAFEDDERVLLASLRKHEEKVSLVPGDLVVASPLGGDDRVVVDRRLPRDFALVRTTAGGREKTMAANVDGIAIVAALARPSLHLAMIDELLAFARLHELRATLVFTKPDLADDPNATRSLAATYRDLDYPVFIINPKFGDVAAVAADLATHRTLLVGQSGVGKSSLFRALGGESTVGEVSKIGRGKQTTTTGRLHRFPGGFLIDSPGVGEFELIGYDRGELAAGFVEIARLAPDCRFADCSHRMEPGCAVRVAAQNGAIAASRYASYLAIGARDQAR